MRSLAGRRVLITGASSGIGAATARLLAERGADVALLARSRAGLERVAAAVRERGRRAVVAPADVTDAAAVHDAVRAAAEALGGLDAVVVNAGCATYGQLGETAIEDVRRTIDVIAVGALTTMRAAMPELERSRGAIVATGSVAGLQPQPTMAAYSAAKHALIGLLGSLRLELRATGSPVRLAMVHPGPVDTPFWCHVTPTRRMPPLFPVAYRPEDVARALVDAVAAPGRDRVVGRAMRAALLGRRLVPAVSDRALAATAAWALRHERDASAGEALWHASGEGRIDGPIGRHHGRVSRRRDAGRL